jgi:hypothetical protein
MYGTRSVLIYLLELEWEVLHKSKELANTGLNPLQMVMTRQESKPKDVMHLKP